ncbi:MAG: anaerobic sulfite reductase subunit AsrA [Nitrospinae bacterium]|nr:anaerobic sulfite reductase subunit AsrA [Nitrospinota bacterium]
MTRFSSEQGNTIFNILSRHYIIIAPVEKPGKGRFSDTSQVLYEQVDSFDEIEFFKKTHLSAKSVLLPLRQTMFSFRDNKPEEIDDEIRPMIIFLRSCDIHAIKVLDAHFLNGGGYTDFYYSRLRQKVKLFLIECEKPFENCFCVSFQTNKTDDWAAFMRKVKDGYEVHVRDEELKAYFPRNAENVAGPRFVEQDSCPIKIPQDIDASIFEDDIWKEYTLRCIACGRCTVVCPTCSCFSVQDILPEDKSAGERKRLWASCMVKKFSILAGNHDFRIKEGDRLRYRMLHKIYDFRKRQGFNMCVGCGRCDDVCPEYISMFKCVEKINHIIEAHSING